MLEEEKHEESNLIETGEDENDQLEEEKRLEQEKLKEKERDSEGEFQAVKTTVTKETKTPASVVENLERQGLYNG